MSHRHHSSVAHQVGRLVHDVSTFEKQESESLYGIEIHDDGTIFDLTYQMNFKSLHEWAEFTVEQDSEHETYEEITSRHRLGDED